MYCIATSMIEKVVDVADWRSVNQMMALSSRSEKLHHSVTIIKLIRLTVYLQLSDRYQIQINAVKQESVSNIFHVEHLLID